MVDDYIGKTDFFGTLDNTKVYTIAINDMQREIIVRALKLFKNDPNSDIDNQDHEADLMATILEDKDTLSMYDDDPTAVIGLCY